MTLQPGSRGRQPLCNGLVQVHELQPAGGAYRERDAEPSNVQPSVRDLGDEAAGLGGVGAVGEVRDDAHAAPPQLGDVAERPLPHVEVPGHGGTV